MRFYHGFVERLMRKENPEQDDQTGRLISVSGTVVIEQE